jgi:hypothetical protein
MKTNPQDYTKLRVLLDSLEVGALRYFLNDTAPSQPQKLKYLQETLMPIIEDLWGEEFQTDCPDGYYDCNGCCVPYRCPDLSLYKAKKPRAGAKRKP